jgi:hypothetical protein
VTSGPKQGYGSETYGQRERSRAPDKHPLRFAQNRGSVLSSATLMARRPCFTAAFVGDLSRRSGTMRVAPSPTSRHSRFNERGPLAWAQPLPLLPLLLVGHRCSGGSRIEFDSAPSTDFLPNPDEPYRMAMSLTSALSASLGIREGSSRKEQRHDFLLALDAAHRIVDLRKSQ